MSSYNIRRPTLAAPISGVAAFAIVAMLPRDDVERRTRGMEPEKRQEVLLAWDCIKAASDVYRHESAARPSARGNAEAGNVVPLRDSESGGTYLVTTAVAAGFLGVSTRRVRQLLEGGSLAGSSVAGRWFTSQEAIDDYKLGRAA